MATEEVEKLWAELSRAAAKGPAEKMTPLARQLLATEQGRSRLLKGYDADQRWDGKAKLLETVARLLSDDSGSGAGLPAEELIRFLPGMYGAAQRMKSGSQWTFLGLALRAGDKAAGGEAGRRFREFADANADETKFKQRLAASGWVALSPDQRAELMERAGSFVVEPKLQKLFAAVADSLRATAAMNVKAAAVKASVPPAAPVASIPEPAAEPSAEPPPPLFVRPAEAEITPDAVATAAEKHALNGEPARPAVAAESPPAAAVATTAGGDRQPKDSGSVTEEAEGTAAEKPHAAKARRPSVTPEAFDQLKLLVARLQDGLAAFSDRVKALETAAATKPAEPDNAHPDKEVVVKQLAQLKGELETARRERDEYKARPTREEFERLKREADARAEDIHRAASQEKESAVQGYKARLRNLVDTELIGVPDSPVDKLSEGEIAVLADKLRNLRKVFCDEGILRP